MDRAEWASRLGSHVREGQLQLSRLVRLLVHVLWKYLLPSIFRRFSPLSFERFGVAFLHGLALSFDEEAPWIWICFSSPAFIFSAELRAWNCY